MKARLHVAGQDCDRGGRTELAHGRPWLGISVLTYKCCELPTARARHIWISLLMYTHKLTKIWLGCETALCGFHQSTPRYLSCSKTMQLFRSDLWKSVSQGTIKFKIKSGCLEP